MAGQQDSARLALLTAERFAAEQVHHHYLAKRVVRTLIRNSPNKPSVEFARLADRMGIMRETCNE
jgi:hypothetical protein